MLLEIYALDPARFLTAPGLAWQAVLTKTKIKVDLWTDIDILMVEKGIRGGISHAMQWYAEANSKYMKNYNKNEGSSYLKDLYGWSMSQKVRLGDFKWVKETSQFNENPIKSFNEDSNIGYFLKIHVQCHDNWSGKRIKIEKPENPVVNLHD